ncbi:CDGSH iron-sulfur domain-containing protein [Lentibacillus saliphilus]|uniref:CDGSH iron-sulfur domain-containing protein n=1 Tax=Lentibacillus saliphilus TaxID=2737028 RepID=UPI001C2F27E8|nr:CDGSH iron-sulfur domain-containing protein [Lentibacillus saliphilus]
MSEAKIKVNDNGSLLLTGSFEVVDADGDTFETKKAVSLCRCGESANKPFCDGTHKKIGFESTPRADKE